MKYRVRSQNVEAMQYRSDGNNWKEIGQFGGIGVWKTSSPMIGVIEMPDGNRDLLWAGDWLVKTADGRAYSCRSGIFDAIFEPAE